MIEEKIKLLGITLPEPPKAAANYIPVKRVGSLIFVSGQLPMINGTLKDKGKLGINITVEIGKLCSEICAKNILSVLKSFLGSLDRIKSVVKITGYIASSPNFTEQHLVLNGASELFSKVFGEKGLHSRVAIGVPSLPLDSPVEVEGIFEIDENI